MIEANRQDDMNKEGVNAHTNTLLYQIAHTFLFTNIQLISIALCATQKSVQHFINAGGKARQLLNSRTLSLRYDPKGIKPSIYGVRAGRSIHSATERFYSRLAAESLENESIWYLRHCEHRSVKFKNILYSYSEQYTPISNNDPKDIPRQHRVKRTSSSHNLPGQQTTP